MNSTDKLHENWKVALPMLLTDLVYWQSEEGQEKFNVSPELINQIKYRLKNIVANIGRDEVRMLCENDGFYLNNEWFDSL